MTQKFLTFVNQKLNILVKNKKQEINQKILSDLSFNLILLHSAKITGYKNRCDIGNLAVTDVSAVFDYLRVQPVYSF